MERNGIAEDGVPWCRARDPMVTGTPSDRDGGNDKRSIIIQCCGSPGGLDDVGAYSDLVCSHKARSPVSTAKLLRFEI